MEFSKLFKRRKPQETGVISVIRIGHNQDHEDLQAQHVAAKMIQKEAGKKAVYIPAGETTVETTDGDHIREVPALQYRWFRRRT